MDRDMTAGSITAGLLKFAFPLMAGNVLQQFYNLADTLIVGRVLGSDALAAVGASYTLMTFLTSIVMGLCMGSSAYFAMQYGKRDYNHLHQGIFLSFLLIFLFTLALNLFAFLSLHWIIGILQIPPVLQTMTEDYLFYIFMGISATFLYNFFANLMRAVGNSLIPLVFLGISVALNILLDILFVMIFRWNIQGAAVATVIAQFASGMGIACYCHFFCPMLRIRREDMRWNGKILKEIFSLSFLTCLQQSVMNFGILMIQGLVNSFGTTIMAAFAAAVKIDTLAYMPVQDFGNAFSTFTAQNYGAGKTERIKKGIRSSVLCILAFCTAVSLAVCLFARNLMGIFIDGENSEVIQAGVRYLQIEAAFYFGIGILFMLYGYYRAIERPGMSVILTLCSLGTRVALSYALSGIPSLGVTGIWISIPIGWALADAVGISYYFIAMSQKRS